MNDTLRDIYSENPIMEVVDKEFLRLQQENIGLRAKLEAAEKERDQYQSGEHPNQVMREEIIYRNLQNKGIEFTDGRGNNYRLIYNHGDTSVGVFPGWECEDEFFLAKDLRELSDKIVKLNECIADKNKSFSMLDEQNARHVQERDEARRQVEVMRGALEEIADTKKDASGVLCRVIARDALQSTPDIIQDLKEV